jgi:hypothetical protein
LRVFREAETAVDGVTRAGDQAWLRARLAIRDARCSTTFFISS